MKDEPRDPTRPEDRPVDPEAVARLERLADPAAAPEQAPGRGAAGAGPLLGPRPRSRPGTRSNLVTTAGAILLVLGIFVATVAVLVVRASDGLTLVGIDLDGSAAAALFVVLAIVYAVAGVLVLLRVPAGRPLGLAVGALALLIGLAQLPSAGLNGIPTVGVAGFILYALGVGGSDFRRG